MKVYIVIWMYEGEQGEIEGVFASRELAEERMVAEHEDDYRIEEAELQGYPVRNQLGPF